MADLKNRGAASGFNRRAFIGGAAGAASLDSGDACRPADGTTDSSAGRNVRNGAPDGTDDWRDTCRHLISDSKPFRSRGAYSSVSGDGCNSQRGSAP